MYSIKLLSCRTGCTPLLQIWEKVYLMSQILECECWIILEHTFVPVLLATSQYYCHVLYNINVPVLYNTGKFQNLGLEVYFAQICNFSSGIHTNTPRTLHKQRILAIVRVFKLEMCPFRTWKVLIIKSQLKHCRIFTVLCQ